MSSASSNNAAIPCLQDSDFENELSVGNMCEASSIQSYTKIQSCHAYADVFAHPGYETLAGEVRESRILHYSSCQNCQQQGACWGLLP
jgi:hypothetical protein